MTPKTLTELHKKHQGKVSDKWSFCLDQYERLFNPLRDKAISLFEIGIQNGGSLEVWSKYFPRAKVFVGCDIDKQCSKLTYQDPRINLVVGDANQQKIQKEVIQKGGPFDIVIDDGSHRSGDIIKSFVNYFPHLADSGVYVIEDLHCSYWEDFEGGLFAPYSSMTFLKQLTDLVNYEHWGLSRDYTEILKGFSVKYDLKLKQDVLEKIESIEFLNSMCVIRKSSGKTSELGLRIVTGKVSAVSDVEKKVNLTKSIPPSQVNNVFSERRLDPPEEIIELHKKIQTQETKIQTQETKIQTQESSLNLITNSRSWRITKPLREFVKFIKLFRQLIYYFEQEGIKKASKKFILGYRKYGLIGTFKKALLISKNLDLQEKSLYESKPIQTISKRKIVNFSDIKVVVIIPVYKGLDETKNCVKSVLSAKNKTKFQIVIINDCSPIRELNLYIQSLHKNKKIKLIFNDENLGFVKTVNKGMKNFPAADVLLLNSDTEVCDNWLDNLVWHAYANNNIATVTPFSNNATICSYPTIYGSKSLPLFESLETINNAFQDANKSESIEIPTAVGFCMFIKRKVINEIGYFDENAFGKGYGEENDFCLRASNAGWKHLLACDTFVFHAGEASFQADSAAGKLNAMNILRKRYPNYEETIRKHVICAEADPYRVSATASRYKLSGKPVVLFIGHNIGGGTKKHCQELAARDDSQCHFLLMKPSLNSPNIVDLTSLRESDALSLRFDITSHAEHIASFLNSCNLSKVHIHHVLGFPEGQIKRLVALLNLPFYFTVHDYFLICPKVNMTIDGKYCGEKSILQCNSCMSKTQYIPSNDIVNWRYENSWLFNDAVKVFTPSEDTNLRVLKYFPSAKTVVRNHEDLIINELNYPTLSPNEFMRVLIIGWIVPHKGLQLVKDLIGHIKNKKLNVKILVIGSSLGEIRKSAIYNETGEYSDSDLPLLIKDLDPHAILFTPMAPETYSYTLSQALITGRPLIIPEIGAFPERVSDRDLVWKFSPDKSIEIFSNIFLEIKNTINSKNRPLYNYLGKALPISYEQYYLSKKSSVNNKHDETLKIVAIVEKNLNDIPTPCAYIRVILPYMFMKSRKKINFQVVNIDDVLASKPDVIVTHRIAIEPNKVTSLIVHCKNNGINLIYDLDDDLIGIANSDHPEKSFYTAYQDSILKISKAATKVTVSTEKLMLLTSQYTKNIELKQNMLLGSLWDSGFQENKNRSSEIKILYMGTQTHQKDFEFVLPILSKINKKFKNKVQIYIIGITPNKLNANYLTFIDVPHEAGVSYPAFVKWLKSNNDFDIGIAPLIKNEFNHSKSCIKFLDYSALGLASLCSNIDAYKNTVKHGINGLLAENTEQDWFDKLEKLILDQDLRNKLSLQAYKDLKQSFFIESA